MIFELPEHQPNISLSANDLNTSCLKARCPYLHDLTDLPHNARPSPLISALYPALATPCNNPASLIDVIV